VRALAGRKGPDHGNLHRMWAAETISLTPKRAPRSSDAPGGYSGRRVNHRPLAHIERPPGSGGVTVGAGAELLGYQQRALDRLRKHAYNRSSFYRHFHAGKLDQPHRVASAHQSNAHGELRSAGYPFKLAVDRCCGLPVAARGNELFQQRLLRLSNWRDDRAAGRLPADLC
jgi:hypothetical protein